MKDSEKSTLDSITLLGVWTKKTHMILAIAVAVLFLVLLILVITNRRRIGGEIAKLEEKVDSTTKAVDIEIKEVLKKHEEDITALKSVVEKGKK